MPWWGWVLIGIPSFALIFLFVCWLDSPLPGTPRRDGLASPGVRGTWWRL